MFVIYERDTTKIIEVYRKNSGWKKSSYKTMSAAKAALTRILKARKDIGGFDLFNLAIAEISYYQDKIEKQVEKTNMMTGKKYMESINTPSYMSPSSEAYWSM